MATTTELLDITYEDKRTDQGLAMVDISKPGTPILNFVTKYVSVVPGEGPVKCWLDNGDFVIADKDGVIPDAPTKKIVVVDTTISEDGYASSSVITRGEGGSTTKTEQGINELNARETIAMNVMVNILKTMSDPIEISNTAIDMLVGKSFRIAQTFLDTASAKRKELGENVTETTVENDPVERIAEKIDEIVESLSEDGAVVNAIKAEKDVKIVGGAVDANVINDIITVEGEVEVTNVVRTRVTNTVDVNIV